MRPLEWWHLASLDAPSVAVAWSFAFAWALGLRLALWTPALLACVTWVVYVGDRLLDAYRGIRAEDHSALRERHYYHWRHRRSLIPIACAIAAIALALVIDRMSPAIRNRNSVLAAAALVYFSGVHFTARFPLWLRKVVSKEMLVGLLFTAGSVAPAIWRVHVVAWPFCLCFAVFAMLAWVNCTAIESWESSRSRSSMRLSATAVSIACIVACAALSSVNARMSALAACAAISALLLLLLDHKRAAISALTLRALADLVLLAPLLAILAGAIRP